MPVDDIDQLIRDTTPNVAEAEAALRRTAVEATITGEGLANFYDTVDVATTQGETDDDIRHRDEQLVDGPARYTLPRGVRGRFETLAGVQAAPSGRRNKLPKRKKGTSGSQYNRIRSSSTL